MALIALYQAQTGIDPDRNADALTDAVSRATAGGAAMLFTPEMSNLLDRDRARSATRLRSEGEDRVLADAREAAARHGIWVHLGSLAVRTAAGKLANRSFLIDDTGAIRARYDKMHLFDVDLPTGESWRESASYEAGDATTVVRNTPVGALGLTICYDLRFPALFASLAEAGADTIAVPAAFTVPTGQAHWQILLRARAIEAGVFVVAAAQAGRHEDGRETYGHSLVTGPWGEVLLEMEDQPGLAFVDVQLEQIAATRSRVPALNHRRVIPSPVVVD
ncbi:carbon-nitrogen hydrolase family protein [Sphingomonas ginkgonis]|uniref:Carbon-nitrogen hydrolase family protein n=1 Tax=Sphingomonas ginkgonis TaxID=2315330 RepID=A0A429VDE6_9SPHN|nr:carbon-nitrogen hydrolase family protein [Sphingomonas ginkgonis]RST31852.1 carbon-nitrogen hydrolase family protein [Sphingomonas ginkgonis]